MWMFQNQQARICLLYLPLFELLYQNLKQLSTVQHTSSPVLNVSILFCFLHKCVNLNSLTEPLRAVVVQQVVQWPKAQWFVSQFRLSTCLRRRLHKCGFLCKRTKIYAVWPCVDMPLSLRVLGQDKTLNPPMVVVCEWMCERANETPHFEHREVPRMQSIFHLHLWSTAFTYFHSSFVSHRAPGMIWYQWAPWKAGESAPS